MGNGAARCGKNAGRQTDTNIGIHQASGRVGDGQRAAVSQHGIAPTELRCGEVNPHGWHTLGRGRRPAAADVVSPLGDNRGLAACLKQQTQAHGNQGVFNKFHDDSPEVTACPMQAWSLNAKTVPSR